jgi:hypothetical protein
MTMLRPLKQWFCDKCGNVIDGPEEGYVIWKRNAEHKDYDFRIIHQNECDDRAYSCSEALKEFLGRKGLAYILSFLSLGIVINALGSSAEPDVLNMDEFVDFIRRVQTPYYEDARIHYRNPEILDRLVDSNKVAPYTPENCELIVRELS